MLGLFREEWFLVPLPPTTHNHPERQLVGGGKRGWGVASYRAYTQNISMMNTDRVEHRPSYELLWAPSPPPPTLTRGTKINLRLRLTHPMWGRLLYTYKGGFFSDVTCAIRLLKVQHINLWTPCLFRMLEKSRKSEHARKHYVHTDKNDTLVGFENDTLGDFK